MLALVTPTETPAPALKKPAGPPWFALRCIGDPALRAMPLFEQFKIEAYYPVVREMRAVPRRKLSLAQRNSGVTLMRQRDVPFLPGIVFTQMGPGHPRQGDIFERSRILGFLCVGDKNATPIPHWEIEKLKAREVGGVIAGSTPANMLFTVGEDVLISDGPFTSFKGKIEQVPDVAIEDIDADTRLKLAVEWLGRFVSMELAAWQIEKL